MRFSMVECSDLCTHLHLSPMKWRVIRRTTCRMPVALLLVPVCRLQKPERAILPCSQLYRNLQNQWTGCKPLLKKLWITLLRRCRIRRCIRHSIHTSHQRLRSWRRSARRRRGRRSLLLLVMVSLPSLTFTSPLKVLQTCTTRLIPSRMLSTIAGIKSRRNVTNT